jgi:hypothetical protein
VVFTHAYRMGPEGIVSKLRELRYWSGRSPDWVKLKNPHCEAVRRERSAQEKPARRLEAPSGLSDRRKRRPVQARSARSIEQ